MNFQKLLIKAFSASIIIALFGLSVAIAAGVPLPLLGAAEKKEKLDSSTTTTSSPADGILNLSPSENDFYTRLNAIPQNIISMNIFTTINEIIKINKKIDTERKNILSLQEENKLNDQKMILLSTLPIKLDRKDTKIGIDIYALGDDKRNLEIAIGSSSLETDKKTLQIIELEKLLAQEALFNTFYNFREKIGFFTSTKKLEGILNLGISYFDEKLQKNNIEIPKSTGSASREEIIKQLNNLNLTIITYREVLVYVKDHIEQTIPQNILMNLTIEWTLEKINKIIPIYKDSLLVAKFVLCTLVLVVLLSLRKLLARIVWKISSYFVKFNKQDKKIQNQIIQDITTPISWILILFSTDIALDVIFYPKISPTKIENLINIGYTLSSVWFLIALLKSYGTAIISLLAQNNSNGFRKEVINLILKILYFTIIVIAILVILNNLGFNISAIVASLGIGGLAVALAIKDTLANFFASVTLLFDNSFGQGDWIVTDNVEGTVVEMGLRRTTIRTFDNALLFVPNSILANGCIRNWNRRKVGRRIQMQIGVTYSSSIEAIQKTINDVSEYLLNNDDIAKCTDDCTKEKIAVNQYQLAMRKEIISVDDLVGIKNTHFVRLDSFGGSSINFQIYCFSKSVEWMEWLRVKEEVMFAIMQIVANNGLSFAFPSQSLYVESLPSNVNAMIENYKNAQK